MNRKKWKEQIIFLFVAITGLVFFALFLFDKSDTRTGIIGVFTMMLAFWYASLLERTAIRKSLISLGKEIKELKNKK